MRCPPGGRVLPGGFAAETVTHTFILIGLLLQTGRCFIGTARGLRTVIHLVVVRLGPRCSLRARHLDSSVATLNDSCDLGATPGWLRGLRGVAVEMIVRADWSAHAIGAPHHWPPPLRVLMSTMLGSPDAMHLVWGPDRVFLFNDACAAILSERATTAMGARFEEVWPDAWPALKGYVERAMGGESVRFVDVASQGSRHRMTTDGSWSFSYTPARDEDGVVRGIVCTTVDTTDDVRRRDALALVEHRAKANLERSEAGLRRAQRAGGIGIFSVDRENRQSGRCAAWTRWKQPVRFRRIGRDRPAFEGAISAARTAPPPPHVPALQGRTRAADNKVESPSLPRRSQAASRDTGRARQAPDCRCCRRRG